MHNVQEQRGKWIPLKHLIAQTKTIGEGHQRDPLHAMTLGEMTRGRWDHHLSRSILWDLHESTTSLSPANLLDLAIKGLTAPSAALVESTWAVATNITFSRLITLSGDYGRAEDWKLLATLLWSDPPREYALGPREQAVLSIGGHQASEDIQDYVALRIEASGHKRQSSVETWIKTLDQTLDFLRIADPTFEPGGAISFASIGMERRSRRESGIPWGGVPWDANFYRCRLALRLDAICQELWRIQNVAGYAYEHLRSVLLRATNLSKTAWTLIHDARKNKERTNSHDNDASQSLQGLWCREQDLLTTSAKLLSIIGENTEAAIFAGGANIASPVSPMPVAKNDTSESRERARATASALPYASKGLVDDAAIKGRQIDSLTVQIALGACVAPEESLKFNTMKEWPRFAESFWHADPTLKMHYAALDMIAGATTLQSTIGLVERIARRPTVFTDEIRNAAFELALARGRPLAAAYIALGRRSQQGGNQRDNRDPLRLSQDQLIRIATQVSTLVQRTAHIANLRRQSDLRWALRRLWRDFTDAKGSLTEHQTLFIHEVKRGMLEPTLRSFHSPDELREMRYGDQLDMGEARAFFDLAARRSYDHTFTAVGIEELRDLVIPTDAVFVSLSIRDGHELSVVIVPPANNQPAHFVLSTVPIQETSDYEDWSKLADIINNGFHYWVNGKARSLSVPWCESFSRLGRRLIQEILTIDPRCRMVFIAMDECLRGLPWQDLFSGHLKSYVASNRRRRNTFENRPLVVCHVPSVYHFYPMALLQRTPRARAKGTRKFSVDISDPELSGLHMAIRAHWLNETIKQPIGIISVLRHGTRSKQVVGVGEDRTSTQDLLHECQTYDLALLHVCNAGFFSEAPRGDLGGFPGMLNSFGVTTVVAPVAPVPPRIAEALERYVAAWLGDRRKSFIDMYADAILETPAVALYSVFGNPTILDRYPIGHLAVH